MKRTLTWLGGAAGALLAVMALQSEVSIRLDTLIVTEAEAADWAEQNRINRLQAQIEVLLLKLKHAENQQQRNGLQAELFRAKRELVYVLCTTDPRMNPDQCIP